MVNHVFDNKTKIQPEMNRFKSLLIQSVRVYRFFVMSTSQLIHKIHRTSKNYKLIDPENDEYTLTGY